LEEFQKVGVILLVEGNEPFVDGYFPAIFLNCVSVGMSANVFVLFKNRDVV
jgi:hypothetical protein